MTEGPVKKPKGFKEFDQLMQKLVNVPKDEMESASEATPKRKSRTEKPQE